MAFLERRITGVAAITILAKLCEVQCPFRTKVPTVSDDGQRSRRVQVVFLPVF